MIPLIISVIVIGFGFYYYIQNQSNFTFYEVIEDSAPINNPLKGYMANAKEISLKRDTELKFVLVNWSDIEKEKGDYSFDELESINNFDKWIADEKRFIIRIVCDYPNDANTMQIPAWLYDLIEGDGTWYDNSYGTGFSPNYANELFIEAHTLLISAFSERYDDNPYVVGFQLGSVGHWGEWHINHDEDLDDLPRSNITDKYVQAYLDNFKKTSLFMRRPFEIAKREQLGLFNDSFGYSNATREFNQWIDKGYVSEQNQEEQPAMPFIWKTSIMGGEFASRYSFDYYFEQEFKSTYAQALDSHITYLGPNAPLWVKQDDSLNTNIEELSRAMGYTFNILKIGISEKKELAFKLRMINSGIAPMLENWPMQVTLKRLDNSVVEQVLVDGELNQWHDIPWDASGAFKNVDEELYQSGYMIEVAILSPTTNKPAIKLAIQNEISENTYLLLKLIK